MATNPYINNPNVSGFPTYPFQPITPPPNFKPFSLTTPPITPQQGTNILRSSVPPTTTQTQSNPFVSTAYASTQNTNGTSNYNPSPLGFGAQPDPTKPYSGESMDSFLQRTGQGGNNQSVQGTQNTQNANSTDTGIPDRFAKLTALENAAGSYYQPTAEEQATMGQLGNILSSEQLGLAKISNNPEPMDLLTGQSDYLQKQAEAATQPLQAKLGILQARRQAAIQGYQAALGAEQAKLGFQQPVQVSPANALISPITGQQIGGNMALGGSGGLNLSSLADSVISGQMSPSQAYATLPSQALTYALQQAIKSKNPNFDFVNAEAQASARTASTQQTGTIGGQISKAADSAKQALNTLKTQFAQLNGAVTGGIPFTNNIATWLGQQFGNQAVSQYESVLHDARNQVEGVLVATGAVTPTDAGATANAYLPDGMTAGQFQSKMDALLGYTDSNGNQVPGLIDQKVSSFTSQNNQAGQTNQGGLYDW